MTPEYLVTLYDLNDQPVMEISRFIRLNMEFVLNDVSTIEFDIDLDQFEALCASVNATPRNLIYPQRTEIKIQRDGEYLFGGIVSNADSTLDEQDKTLHVTADSYIHYFASRYLSKTYTSTDRSDIAWDAIDTVQSVTNGDLGVTEGTLATTYDSDLTADYEDVKSIIQRYTYAQPTTYDFEITPLKVFNTYTRLGSDKPQVVISYPEQIKSMEIPRGADSLANKIIGLGSGIGEERIQSIQTDSTSAITYRLKERKSLFNSVKEQSTLDDNTEGVLEQTKNVLVLPDVKINGIFFDISEHKVGDAVTVLVSGSIYNDDVNGLFRIYKMSVSVDENMSEDISLNFYKPGLGGEISE